MQSIKPNTTVTDTDCGNSISELTTSDLQHLDSAHYLHPFSDSKSLQAKGARIMVRGDGVYIWDTDGRRLIDGMSGLWCVNVGYGRDSIAELVIHAMISPNRNRVRFAPTEFWKHVIDALSLRNTSLGR